MHHVVADQLEVGAVEQPEHIRLLTGEEVVDADDVMAVVDQALAQMRAEKPGAAGHKNPLEAGHGNSNDVLSVGNWRRADPPPNWEEHDRQEL